MNSLTVSSIVLAVLVLFVTSIYNRLVQLRLRAKEALSDIDVQLKRRYDLIPNLVETVKGYLKHERTVLENVTQARTQAVNATGNPLERNDAETPLSGTLKTLFAVAENYPDLKANANFLELQRELADTENKIKRLADSITATLGISIRPLKLFRQILSPAFSALKRKNF